MSTPRTVSKEDVLAAEANPQLQRLAAAMNKSAPSEEDRKLLLALGLDPATVAEMVGHEDGGYLIATVYTKLGRRRALARAQRAMDDYEQRQTAADIPRHLHVVGGE
ncbi:MAG TPA: hypothetical protein VGX69_07325 [Solirubrobacteraceae bacterium]|jgi:hypothetical protein|nr:hypothetical protein [Solirubrobacteraceae bacterium]